MSADLLGTPGGCGKAADVLSLEGRGSDGGTDPTTAVSHWLRTFPGGNSLGLLTCHTLKQRSSGHRKLTGKGLVVLEVGPRCMQMAGAEDM